jgi:hypothetical protein
MNIKLFLILFSYCILLNAQTIPVNRTVNWKQAGHYGAFMEPNNNVNFKNFGGYTDGVTANDSIFNVLLSNINTGDSTVIYFSNGTYYFNKKINLPENTILRGENIDSTILLFNLLSQNHLIEITGNATNDTSYCIADAFKDSICIKLNNTNLFLAGDFIYIIDNDSSLITSAWAVKSTGQICRIDSISGNTLFLKNAIRRNFTTAKNTFVRKLKPKKNVGIENLKIIRQDSTNTQTDNIHFEYAYNCWVKCIESINCNFAHIGARYSSNLEISSSYFHDAFDYGGNGKAYGVMLHFGTGECLISENHFNHLRHSIILQAGANGNVFGYNYSRNPFWTGVSLPSNSAGDLVLHGNYPYTNLFEGNTVQNIVIDDSHGINGNYNTFFRNRAELYGFFMNSGTPTNNQNIVGNEITNTTFPLGLYSLSGTGHFEFGNNHKGSIVPNGTNNLPEASLYLLNIPTYYQNNSAWPPIGIPNNLSEYNIEMEEIFLQGKNSLCSNEIIPGIDVKNNVGRFILYPNPCSNFLKIELINQKKDNISEVVIYSSNGKIVYNSKETDIINVQNLSAGVYLVRIVFDNNTSVSQRFIKLL